MLNVGGGVPHQGPLVHGLTIAFNKCPPLLGRNQWLQPGSGIAVHNVKCGVFHLFVCLFVLQPHIGQYCCAIHKAGDEVGDALFFHQGEKSKKRGRNGEQVRTYPLVDAAAAASWKTLQKIEKGKSVQWNNFVAFMSIHRVNAERCTYPTYGTYAMCEGVLLWHIVKVPGFKVPTQYS